MQATAEGHIEMMKKCKPGMRESQLACHLRHLALFKYNIRFAAFPDIIGSGKNSAILHYEKNSKIIEDGDLVLCDCGYRVHGYCADITTTFPANGKFTPKQKQIYELVLKINKEVQKMLKPGESWKAMGELAAKLLLEGLKELGILKGDIMTLLKSNVNRLFMPHSLGHLLVI